MRSLDSKKFRIAIGAVTLLAALVPGKASALDFKITDRQATSQAALCNALADALENANATATRGMGWAQPWKPPPESPWSNS